jgi:hypothetical protein
MKRIRRVRPYIPLKVRVEVAERQAKYYADPLWWQVYCAAEPEVKLKPRLKSLLQYLFDGKAHLDHDPALILRVYDPVAKTYTPDANDPDFLIYRGIEEHLEKTVGRKVGALKTVTTKGSDIWMKTKFKRLEQPSATRQRIPSRPFPKTKRKIQSRGFRT